MSEFKIIEEEYNNIIQLETKNRKYQQDLLDECSNKIYNMKKIMLLVQLAGNVNSLDKNGNSSLHYACDNNNLELIQYLVEHGANVNLQNNDGQTALHLACINNNLEIIQYLVEHGANVNLQDKEHSTALYFVSYKKNNLEIIRYLVENDANVNLQNNSGYTALHNACTIENNLEVIEYLVKQGTNVNLQSYKGKTPLHIVTFGLQIFHHLDGNSFKVEGVELIKQFEVIKCLVENGTNVNLQDNNGKIALYDLSERYDCLEIVKYLRKHGAKYSFFGFKY